MHETRGMKPCWVGNTAGQPLFSMNNQETETQKDQASNIKMGGDVPPTWAERGNVSRTNGGDPSTFSALTRRTRVCPFLFFFFYTVYVQDCRLLPLWETRRFPKKQGNTIPRLFSIQIGAEANGRFLTFWCPPGSRISKISAPTHSLLTLPVPSAPLDNQSYKPNKLTRQQGRWYSPKRATGKLSNISGFPLISKSHSMFTSLTTGWYKRIHNHTPKPEKNKGVHESETKMAWVWFYCFVQTFFHSKNQNQT